MLNLDELQTRISEKHHRPLIGLKWAQTLDGQLADDAGKSKWISGAEELSYTHRLRAQYDAVMVGASTFLQDHSKLTVRTPGLSPHFIQPVRLVFDPKNRVLEKIRSQNAGVLAALDDGAARPTVLLNCLPKGRFTQIDGYHVYSLNISPDFENDLGLKTLQTFSFQMLKRNLNKIMIEGGPATLKLFIQRGLVDVACVGIAPLLTGGYSNRIQLKHELDAGLRLKHHATHTAGEDTVIEMISKEISV